MIIDAGYCFWLGVSFGFGVGAIFVKLVQYATGPRKSKVGTPSASHNKQSTPRHDLQEKSSPYNDDPIPMHMGMWGF